MMKTEFKAVRSALFLSPDEEDGNLHANAWNALCMIEAYVQQLEGENIHLRAQAEAEIRGNVPFISGLPYTYTTKVQYGDKA